jgi:hypothetical protein
LLFRLLLDQEMLLCRLLTALMLYRLLTVQVLIHFLTALVVSQQHC